MTRPSSRRMFVRSTVAGGVGALVARSRGGMDASDLRPREGTPPSSLTSLDLAAASELLRARKASALELTQACLKRIEELNPRLNAFITARGTPTTSAMPFRTGLHSTPTVRVSSPRF